MREVLRNVRRVATGTLLGISVTLSALPARAACPARPNIILFVSDDLAWVHLPFFTSSIKWNGGTPSSDTPTGRVSQGPRVLISPTLNRLDARLLANDDGTYYASLGSGASIPYNVTPVIPVDDPTATGSYTPDACDPMYGSCDPAEDILHGHGGLRRLADAGMVFTRFYATSVVCTPTRASLMTGRHGFKTEATDYQTQQKLKDYDNNKTIAKYLKEETCPPNGTGPCYATGLIGKWHVTSANPEDPDPMGGYVATHLGFDEAISDNESQRGYFSLNALGCFPGNLSLDASGQNPGGGQPVGSDLGACVNRQYPVQGNRNNCETDSASVQGASVSAPCPFSPRVYRDLAENFIDRHHNETFFLTVAFNVVHDPHNAPSRSYSHYTTNGLNGREKGHRARGGGKKYWALIEEMDAAIGRIMQRLDAWGLTDETLVMFTTDQGQDGGAAEWGEPALRGSKTTVEEGGIRVPFIASACGGTCDTSSGQTCRTDRVGSHVDVLRTIANAAGISTSLGSGTSYEVEGQSLWTAINNKNAALGTTRDFAFAAEQLKMSNLNSMDVVITTREGYATAATFFNDTVKQNPANAPNGICGYEGQPISVTTQHRLRGSSCVACNPDLAANPQCTTQTCTVLGRRCVSAQNPLDDYSPACTSTGQCAPGETCETLTINCNVCRKPAWKLKGEMDGAGNIVSTLGLWNLATDPEEQIDCKGTTGLGAVRSELECTLQDWAKQGETFVSLENGKLNVPGGAGFSCRDPS